ncbi:MAG: hypothetical protein AAF404_16415, partial [Pseudomonadota bacterium]
MSVTPIPETDLSPEKLATGDREEFVSKMGTRDTKLQAHIDAARVFSQQTISALDALDTAVADDIAALADLQQRISLNYFPANGAFLEQDDSVPNGMVLVDDADFTGEGFAEFFKNYNSSDTAEVAAAGRFNYNSSTAGGSADANSGAGLDFAVAMGSDNRRFVSSFSVLQMKSGTGTANGINYNNCYLFFSNGNVAFLGAGRGSIAVWYRPLVEDAFIQARGGSSGYRNYVDGVLLEPGGGVDGSDYYRLNAGQVYHLCGTINTTNTVALFPLPLCAKHESQHQFALPWVSSSGLQLLPHNKPIPSIPTLIDIRREVLARIEAPTLQPVINTFNANGAAPIVTATAAGNIYPVSVHDLINGVGLDLSHAEDIANGDWFMVKNVDETASGNWASNDRNVQINFNDNTFDHSLNRAILNSRGAWAKFTWDAEHSTYLMEASPGIEGAISVPFIAPNFSIDINDDNMTLTLGDIGGGTGAIINYDYRIEEFNDANTNPLDFSTPTRTLIIAGSPGSPPIVHYESAPGNPDISGG